MSIFGRSEHAGLRTETQQLRPHGKFNNGLPVPAPAHFFSHLAEPGSGFGVDGRFQCCGGYMVFQLSVLLVMILAAGAAGGLTIFALDRELAPGRVRR